ncbi:MAG TPA: M4 family metallopeptidase, partial [Candidatus Lustribacter sp.]|nr:M4 family metallopeptidase [Candidatus Lustribacter sp.]
LVAQRHDRVRQEDPARAVGALGDDADVADVARAGIDERAAEAFGRRGADRPDESGAGAAEDGQVRPADPGAGALEALRPGAAPLGGPSPALVWVVTAMSAEGLSRTLVDARTGEVRDVRVISKGADGTGRVFLPNPVVTLRDESLVDKGDRNQVALRPAYQDVVLSHLDGNGRLTGSAVRIVRARGGLAKSATSTFGYLRADDRFEQVNAYYAVDISQTYLQRLGFTDANNEAQRVAINTYAGDNSFYDPDKDLITFGLGGVDDAEDAEVIWHEYGHAIQDAIVPGFGSTEEAGAIGEGFGDYWAVTMSVPSSRGFDLPCVMDWDATSYTSGPSHCLRRVDGVKTVADMDGEVHDDGEIWSRALWDIHRGLGRAKANRVVIESTYFFSPDTTFASAARQTVQAARALYGADAAAVVSRAFQDRGIL